MSDAPLPDARLTDDALTGNLITGHIERAGPDRLEGWCWCQARPTARLTVEILFDDVPVAVVAASLFRRDLAQVGIGDGRHAFVLHMRDAPGPERLVLDRTALIGLRERTTGQMVARLRQTLPDETQREDERLDWLASQLAPVARAVAAPAAIMHAGMQAGATPWRAAFAALGDRLAAQAEWPAAGAMSGTIATAAQAMARTLAPLRLPILGAPSVCVVVRAAEAARTWRDIAALAPALAAMGGELLLVDDGADPRTALLTTLIDNLAITRTGPGFAAAANAAWRDARGRTLVFTTAESAMTVPPMLADTLTANAGCVLIGEAVRAAAEQCGVLHLLNPRTLPVAAAAAGLLLAIPRALVHESGGFDPGLSADEALCALDLALKAAMLGHRVAAAPRPPRPSTPLRGAASPLAPHEPATALFRARWPGSFLSGAA